MTHFEDKESKGGHFDYYYF